MKKLFFFLLAVILLLTGCSMGNRREEASVAVEKEATVKTELAAQVFQNVDFAESPFKHINNGGITEDDTLPYNIDAISGATMTVEGPAVVTSIPLSIRELENRTEGLVRGTYEDEDGMFIYEGLDLYYLLNNMQDGDNGIFLTDAAYKVVLKDSNRAEITTFTLSEVAAAHDVGRPILLAYGIGDGEGNIAPFVFDAKSENTHSLGYIDVLNNDDGCIKLVYDIQEYGSNYPSHFSNVAYVYVCEEHEPGFKHTGSDNEIFGASCYADYIVSFRGSALGHEIDLTVKDLEALVTYQEDGSIVGGGMGYSNDYSLANNAYWYVNKYEGLDLYKLLLYLGMDDAETMGTKTARTTLVSFLAGDGAAASETFSVDTLSYPDVFGFYNKNAADLNDGSYVSTNADLVATGYPVLMAYGVNNYPYTINKTDEAYISGLSNSGGPFRVVFGKTQYNHANGSNQVQYLSEVIVGNDILYNTHKHTENAAQKVLAEDEIRVRVNDVSGNALIERTMTVGEIEDLIFGEDIAGNVKKAVRIKDHYEVNGDSDIYEGVDLEYLLMQILGIPGTNGTASFSNGKDTLSLPLETLFAAGYNTQLGRSGVRSVLAFAKNGMPMVPDAASEGYVKEIKLRPYLDTDPSAYSVDNVGGPLCVLIPSSSAEKCNAEVLPGITEITVDLVPDSYAHIADSYKELQNSTVRFFGSGLEKEQTFSIAELESRQTQAKTQDFSFMTKAGSTYETRYRGLSIYDLFTEVGIRSNAGDVTVYAEDGSSAVFSLSQLKKAYDNFLVPDKTQITAMLAYGIGQIDGELMEGCPLVTDASDTGYSDAFGNDGGPLKLIVPQRSADEVNASMCIKNVIAIEVSANEIDTWSHSMSDVYEEFLESKFTFTVKNEASEWSRDFTVAELEALKDIVVREKYSVLDVGECEGLNMWKFIQLFAGNIPGADEPISITVYANDGYKNDVLSVVYLEGFEKGVATDTGERLPVLLCYAINGYPLVDDENHEGYTGLAGNTAGPLRVIVEGTQGASVKYCVKLVVTLPGNDPIDISVDPDVFGEAKE